jgi:hypothetical protein
MSICGHWIEGMEIIKEAHPMQRVSVVGTRNLISAFEAYCGTYEVNAEKRTVTHHVKANRFPNWEGTDQLRYFEFSGTRLILKTAPIPALGTEWIVSLIWEQMA